jgi:four helix bundle protein
MHGRAPGKFQHFISMAMGSVAELETQVLLSADLGYLAATWRDHLLAELDKVGKMLRGLQKSVRRRSRPPQSPASSPQSQ